jgi:hypothetical protein
MDRLSSLRRKFMGFDESCVSSSYYTFSSSIGLAVKQHQQSSASSSTVANQHSAPTCATDIDGKRKLRILALHGYGQTPDMFRTKTGSFRSDRTVGCFSDTASYHFHILFISPNRQVKRITEFYFAQAPMMVSPLVVPPYSRQHAY